VKVGVLLLCLFGFWGAHRFYLGQKKVGFFILTLTATALLTYKLQFKFSGVLLVLVIIVMLCELLTFYPRIRRHNESLTKHYYDH